MIVLAYTLSSVNQRTVKMLAQSNLALYSKNFNSVFGWPLGLHTTVPLPLSKQQASHHT